MSTSPRARAIPAPPESEPRPLHIGFRPDIEGLRAIAVTLVVLSHSGVATFAGGYIGVDVFFVISGFLITTRLLEELRSSGRISLRSFYARRMLRLLPLSFVVLVATLIGSWWWLPATRFKSISVDALFSTFYGINWRLANEGINYLNATAAPSPLQHLWSLAVEEQFYLIWPLSLLLIFWAGRRGSRRLMVTLGAAVVVSLIISVQQTNVSAPWAYFGSHTRAWELGAGALVAIGASVLTRAPRLLASVLSWSGLAAVIVAALIFNVNTAFPGYAALLPVLGTAAVIAGGTGGTSSGAGTVVGTAPFRFVGKLSYGWYLWHWPVLVILQAEAVGHPPSTKRNLVFALGALGLAFTTYHLVENPVRTCSWLRVRARRGLGLGLAVSGLVAGIAVVAGQFPPSLPIGPPAPDLTAELRSAADPQSRLSQLISESIPRQTIPKNLNPSVEKAGASLPKVYADKCHLGYQQTKSPGACVYGDANGARTMYLIGDSHAAQWFPAFDDLARERGWKLVALTKASCELPSVQTFNTVLKRAYSECVIWRNNTLNQIVKDQPALVVMASSDFDNGGLIDASGKPMPNGGPDEDPVWVQGWQRTWKMLRGIPMMLLQDSPYPPGDAPECLSTRAHLVDTRCVRTVQKAIAEPTRRKLVAAAAGEVGIKVVDTTPWFCTARCPLIVGNTLVFKDNSHITVAYARALEPVIAKAALF